MAALEEMAYILSIITSNIYGIVDYSVDGQTGYNYNPKSINCFSKSIEKISEDKRIKCNFSEKSVEIVQ